MSESSSNPDVLVYYAAGINMDALELKFDSTLDSRVVENAPKGALIVALIDSRTERVIWIGSVTAQVQKNIDSATAKARMDYAVSKMMTELPK